MVQKPIPQVLNEIKNGQRGTLGEVLPLVYEELHRLEKLRMSQECSNRTLQPAALVYEAYLRLVGKKETEWQNRAHFFGSAARLMREILNEHMHG